MKHKIFAILLIAAVLGGCTDSVNVNDEAEPLAETPEDIYVPTDITPIPPEEIDTPIETPIEHPPETTPTENIFTEEINPVSLYLNRDLTQEDIEDLKPHKGLILYIEAEGIDISLLSQLDSIEMLSISQSEDLPGGLPLPFVSDFSFLKDMTSLRVLNLGMGGFEFNIDHIANLRNLEILSISNAIISLEERIEGFPNLRKLSIWGSDIKSISPFCGLNLYKLDLYGCTFDDNNLDSINEISSLIELRIDFSNDIEFTTFNGLNNLRELTLHSENAVINIESLFELTQLERLTTHWGLMSFEQLTAFKEMNPDCIIRLSSGQDAWDWTGEIPL